MENRRIASFEIPIEIIDEYPSQVKDLLAEVIILRAENSFISNCVEYLGQADFFKETPRGFIPEHIDIVLHKDEDGDIALEFDTWN